MSHIGGMFWVADYCGTTAFRAELVPLWQPLSTCRGHRKLIGCSEHYPERCQVRVPMRHFPFFQVNVLIPAVGFPCIHGGLRAANGVIKEAWKWAKVPEGELESRCTFWLPDFSWLTGIGGSCFRNVFLSIQPSYIERPAALGALTPTQHLWVMASASLYPHGFLRVSPEAR